MGPLPAICFDQLSAIPRPQVFSRDQLLDAVWGNDQFRLYSQNSAKDRTVTPGSAAPSAVGEETVRVNAREGVARRAAMGGLAS